MNTLKHYLKDSWILTDWLVRCQRPAIHHRILTTIALAGSAQQVAPFGPGNKRPALTTKTASESFRFEWE
jgi:hypothetical protein